MHDGEVETSPPRQPPALPHHAGLSPVPESMPNAELLRSLGRLARGLSALFWGLPVALVACVQTGKGDWFRALGVLPPIIATALLYYGLSLLGHFQKQERPWRATLEQAKLFALINLGLSPFLYWWNRIPSEPFFNLIVQGLMLSGMFFLLLLNPLLLRLTAMLPDETLRLETRLFTSINRGILTAMLLLVGVYFVAIHLDPAAPEKAIGWLLQSSPLPPQAASLLYLLDRGGQWFALFFILLPVAMTMALIWKIKEVILASVFGAEH